jgi:hypothetical protein
VVWKEAVLTEAGARQRLPDSHRLVHRAGCHQWGAAAHTACSVAHLRMAAYNNSNDMHDIHMSLHSAAFHMSIYDE